MTEVPDNVVWDEVTGKGHFLCQCGAWMGDFRNTTPPVAFVMCPTCASGITESTEDRKARLIVNAKDRDYLREKYSLREGESKEARRDRIDMMDAHDGGI